VVYACFQDIKNWIKLNINHEILEGLNSVVQAAKRKARGYARQHYIPLIFFLLEN
jgi:transposase